MRMSPERTRWAWSFAAFSGDTDGMPAARNEPERILRTKTSSPPERRSPPPTSIPKAVGVSLQGSHTPPPAAGGQDGLTGLTPAPPPRAVGRVEVAPNRFTGGCCLRRVPIQRPIDLWTRPTTPREPCDRLADQSQLGLSLTRSMRPARTMKWLRHPAVLHTEGNSETSPSGSSATVHRGRVPARRLR